MEEQRIQADLTTSLAGCCSLVERAPLPMGLTLGASHTLHCLSPSLAQLLDAAPTALLHRPLGDVVPPSAAEAVVRLLDRVFSSGVAEVAAVEHSNGHGGTVYWSYAVWPVSIGDELPVALVLQVSDTTARMLARPSDEWVNTEMREINERLLIAGLREQEARADAEAALGLRDQFLSIASHELKTPLTSLLGYTSMLLKGMVGQTEANGRLQPMLGSIDRQANRLNTLIDQLLDVSRIEQGQFSIEQLPIDLGILIRRIVDDVRLTLTRHTIDLTIAGAPLLVLGDALRLEQVVQNLLSNAVKYSPAGGPVLVRLERQAEEVILTVEDQGIGIPAAAREHLFAPFYRAGNAGQRASGFGIGLFVVKEIVARHGGRIEVRSTEGQGSMFRVSLPEYHAER